MSETQPVIEVKKAPPPLKNFEVDESNLSPENKQIFNIFKKAAEEFVNVYDIQKKLPFYPPETDISNQEIRDAAQDNPDILSHYNIVIKDEEGLSTLPYEVVYAEELAPVIDALRAAAEITSNPQQKKYLEAKAQALLTGNYEAAEEAWLEMDEEPVVDLAIGYYEKYMDDRLGMKFAAMAWVGIKDVDKTSEAQEISDKYVSAYGRSDLRIRSRVENTAMLSGFIATAAGLPSATSLPNQKEWRDRYGTKIIFFETVNKESTEKQIPIVRSIYDGASDYSDEEIKNVMQKLLVAHESFHPAIRFEGDEERLGREYTYVNELLPDLLARKISAGLTDIMSEKELRLAAPLLVSKALAGQARGAPDHHPYIQGWATALNYLIENGSIDIQDRKIVINSQEKVMEGISELSNRLEDIAKQGTEQEVKEIKEKYADASVFDRFKLHPNIEDFEDFTFDLE